MISSVAFLGGAVLPCRSDQDGEQDDEFAIDEDDERGERQRARRAGKAPSGKAKKGEKDPWYEA